MSETNTLNIHEILKYLPHRYPFLLIDRVLDYKPGEWLEAIKNVTINEPFFPGHFPQFPVMPGVLITEAMAQATGLLALRSKGIELDGKTLLYLVGIDKARFKQPVQPGDQLHFHVQQLRMTRGIGKFSVEARVDGGLVASAEIMAALREAGS
ncbi:MAG: 3-hydroxyacyl-ACP dehydratase FabZ [Gammaproteobacteria bacterium]|nr:3-hydroxyacyl-ACP dehydratase FabZ [Gammaproteobacteria bacterium]